MRERTKMWIFLIIGILLVSPPIVWTFIDIYQTFGMTDLMEIRIPIIATIFLFVAGAICLFYAITLATHEDKEEYEEEDEEDKEDDIARAICLSYAITLGTHKDEEEYEEENEEDEEDEEDEDDDDDDDDEDD